VTKGIEAVETKYFTMAHEFRLESGRMIAPVTLAYETYGLLNDKKDNAVLVMHAFTGDAHAAGSHKGDKGKGWWDFMIGPGRALDTDRYFVICINVLGGCKGSTGPASVNPKTGKPYGLDFPVVTLGDMVNAQVKLIDHLGIDKVYAVLGGSMGGMLALQWAALHPERVKCVIPIAATLKHSPQQIAFNEVGRQAIMADPAWNGGDYYGKAIPEHGLAVARMLGHITYMSNESMEKKFSRRVKGDTGGFQFSPDFEVEGYLQYRGQNFVKRFDANSYLYITKAMDFFDLSGEKLFEKGDLGQTKFLVIAFKSDWLYPSSQSQNMVRQLKMHHVDATYCEINASYGHDSFLIETEGSRQVHLIKHFLANWK
jgi:homoserine O-acetyltransferase